MQDVGYVKYRKPIMCIVQRLRYCVTFYSFRLKVAWAGFATEHSHRRDLVSVYLQFF